MAPNEVLSLTQFPARRHQAAVQHVQREESGEGVPRASRPGSAGRGRIMGLEPLMTVQTSLDSRSGKVLWNQK